MRPEQDLSLKPEHREQYKERFRILDAHPWQDGVTFQSFGVRIGIRVDAPEILEGIQPYLPPHSGFISTSIVHKLYSIKAPASSGRPKRGRAYELYAGATKIMRSGDFGRILRRLEQGIEYNISTQAKDKLFVHAGVVAWRGRAIVIPGNSRSGKSTLVAALVRAGATYYSDEFAVFDAAGRVHPYARNIRLRGTELNRKYRDLKVVEGKRSIPVGLVAVLSFKKDARWKPVMMSAAEGVLALLKNTILAKYRPDFSLRTFNAVSNSSRFMRGKRGEAEIAAKKLIELAGE